MENTGRAVLCIVSKVCIIYSMWRRAPTSDVRGFLAVAPKVAGAAGGARRPAPGLAPGHVG